MSSLAFDKQGKPFTFHRLARQLAVRVFSNPGGRGSCFPVHDEDGNEVCLDADANHQDFRESVKNVPGQYRLDQYDEHGAAIEGAPAAYVTIRDIRNTSSATDPRDAVLLQMAQSNAELARTNSETTRAAIGEMAAIMRATAEVRHAPVKPPPPVVIEKKEEDEDEDDDDEDEDEDEDEDDDDDDVGRGEDSALAPAPESDPWAVLRPLAPVFTALAPKIGKALADKLIELLNQLMKAGPAAASSSTTTTASATASGPAPSGASASEAAAGTGATAAGPSAPAAAASASAPPPPSSPPSAASPGSQSPAAPQPATEPAATVPVASPVVVADATTGSVATAPERTATALATTAAPVAVADVRNATPTGDQIAHLLAVRAVLTPREVAIVDRAIARMDTPTREGWLAELSALTVAQAAERVRSLLPSEGRVPTPPRKRGDAGEE